MESIVVMTSNGFDQSFSFWVKGFSFHRETIFRSVGMSVFSDITSYSLFLSYDSQSIFPCKSDLDTLFYGKDSLGGTCSSKF